MSASASPLAVFEEFLAPMELAWAHDLVSRQRDAFQASQVIGDDNQGVQDAQHRRSRVLYELGMDRTGKMAASSIRIAPAA